MQIRIQIKNICWKYHRWCLFIQTEYNWSKKYATHWKSIGAFQLSIKLIEIGGYVTQSVLERLCGKRENGVEVLENIFYFSLFLPKSCIMQS